ncbi:MAG: GntR family transcriptional regulator [Victivallaceae bacterium]
MKKYQKIYSDLLAKINKNELKENEKIPTENELCKLYGVSRITAVRAVNELAKDKLIVRHPKTGSFVSSRHFNPLLPFYILIPSFVHNFFTKSSYAFSEYFRNKGCIASIIYTRFNLNYISMVIDSLNNTGCSGIAIYPSAHKHDELPLLKLLEAARFNVAIGYRELEGFSGTEVIIDEYDASAQAVNHLVDLGHRRIAYVGSELEKDEKSNHIRYNAFKKTCAEKGLKEEDCPFIDKTDHLSIHTIKKIFQSKSCPTAVITVSEYYAVIIFDMLTSFGIEIPKTVAIVSIDGGELSSSVEVPLTAIEFPAYKIGEMLAEELYNMAKNPNLGKIKRVFKEKSTIIVRESCGSNTKHRHEYIREKVRM